MSLEKAENYLKEAGFLDHVIELKESTATVALAGDRRGGSSGPGCGTGDDRKDHVVSSG